MDSAKLDSYEKITTCKICGTHFVNVVGYVGCCERCYKDIIMPLVHKIDEYKKTNPNAGVLDISNSGIITKPDNIKIRKQELLEIALQGYSVNGKLLVNEEDEKKRTYYSSALLRDLDEMKENKFRGR